MNPLKRMYARMKRGYPVWDGLPYHMCHVLTVADCMINVKRGLINPGPLVIGVVPFKQQMTSPYWGDPGFIIPRFTLSHNHPTHSHPKSPEKSLEKSHYFVAYTYIYIISHTWYLGLTFFSTPFFLRLAPSRRRWLLPLPCVASDSGGGLARSGASESIWRFRAGSDNNG